MKKLLLVIMPLVFFLGCSENKSKDKEVENVPTPIPQVVAQKEEVKEEVINEVAQNRVEVPLNGKTLFTACISCHGQNGEKKALNVSNIIAGQSKEELINKLNGYKDGSYGGNMKGVMASQVKNLSSEKIEALAEYISNLK